MLRHPNSRWTGSQRSSRGLQSLFSASRSAPWSQICCVDSTGYVPSFWINSHAHEALNDAVSVMKPCPPTPFASTRLGRRNKSTMTHAKTQTCETGSQKVAVSPTTTLNVQFVLDFDDAAEAFEVRREREQELYGQNSLSFSFTVAEQDHLRTIKVCHRTKNLQHSAAGAKRPEFGELVRKSIWSNTDLLAD